MQVGQLKREWEPDISDFGETVFLTRGEVEAKLKELRGNQNGKV